MISACCNPGFSGDPGDSCPHCGFTIPDAWADRRRLQRGGVVANTGLVLHNDHVISPHQLRSLPAKPTIVAEFWGGALDGAIFEMEAE